MTLENPYLDDDGIWIKGNLHAHSNETDGTRPPQEVVDDYAARGYGFFMLSDHDKLIDPSTLNDHGMIMIPGNEVTAQGPHLLHVNAKTRLDPDENRQNVLDGIKTDGGLAIFNHPNWQKSFSHCPQEKLDTWTDYHGIEIYNGVIRRLLGSPLATNRWDQLLGSGKRILGFANDDSHRPEDVGLAWNVALVHDLSAEEVVKSLTRGSFYCSTGVEINRINVTGRTLHVETENASRLTVVSDYGKRIAAANGSELTFAVPDDFKDSYIRVECYGTGEEMAWTQPFFLKKS